MGNAVEDIKSQILTVRRDLRQNLDEVEERVKAFVDWRRAYQSHTGIILAGAALGGFLVTRHFASKRRGAAAPAPHRSVESNSMEPALAQVRAHVAEIQTALVNVLATHAKRLLGQWIPGFAEKPHNT